MTTMTETPLTDLLTAVLTEHDELLRQTPTAVSAAAMTAKKEKAAPEVVLPKGSTEFIERPNGEKYLPRRVVKLGTTDVEFVKTAYANKMPVLLYGSPGTGKTALFEAALPGLVTLVGSAETEVSDFLGSWVQRTDGMYEWIDGPLPRAAEAGVPFLIDEIALIDSRIMTSIVYPLMDGRDEIHVTANPSRGTVKVKEGFVVYGACNPNVPGAIMSDALLSRFQVHVEVFTDWKLAADLGCSTKIITAARNLATKYENTELVAPPQLRELLTFMKVSATFGEDVAIRNFVSQARVEDRQHFIEVMATVFGSTPEVLSF